MGGGGSPSVARGRVSETSRMFNGHLNVANVCEESATVITNARD